MPAMIDGLILISEKGGDMLEGIDRPHLWVFNPDRKGQAEAEAGRVTKQAGPSPVTFVARQIGNLTLGGFSTVLLAKSCVVFFVMSGGENEPQFEAFIARQHAT
jgi:hypothetical protein